MTFLYEIDDAEEALKAIKQQYLQRFGWEVTCNTPGAFWLWRRDFAKEDAARHARWKDGGPGPMGWPSKPRPYGVITADLDMAVRMTVRCLDEQKEISSEEEGPTE